MMFTHILNLKSEGNSILMNWIENLLTFELNDTTIQTILRRSDFDHFLQ